MELKNEKTNSKEIKQNKNEEDSNEELEKNEKSDEDNLNEEEEDTKENDDEDYELSSNSSSKNGRKRITYINFDKNYDYNSNYFYQELNKDELKEIEAFIDNFLSNKSTNKEELSNFFIKYPKILKGNVEIIKQIINDSSEKYPNLTSYKIINDFLISEFYCPKPSICECYFFPDGSNERKVVNILRTCKKSLDIAIYTFTLDSITKGILEVHHRGIPIRIICDNECERHSTSKIKKLASEGIVCKTDNNSYYMHHKFAIIDNTVVITGSFNWSSQAVYHNQENILFLENKKIAEKYTEEFNKLWNNYDNIINKEEAIKYVEEKERIKKEKMELKLKKEREKRAKIEEKLKKAKEKENEKLEKQKEKEKMIKQKEMEKIQNQKERENQKLEKQKEKEKIPQGKEKLKNEKQKEKENQKIAIKTSKRGKKEINKEDAKEPKSKSKKENIKSDDNEINDNDT